MKFYSMFMISAIACGALVSCIDDEESEEVKAIREVELAKEKVALAQNEVSLASSEASLDRTYRSIYTDAVSAVKSLEADAKEIQLQLDEAKSNTAYYENIKTALTDWNNNRIAYNEAQIKLVEAKIAIYQKAKDGIITSEDLNDELVNAEVEYKKEYAEYVAEWQKVVDAGLNLNNAGTYVWSYSNVTSQINVLVGSSYDYSYVPVNSALYNTEFVLAIKDAYNNSSDYTFYDAYREDATYNNYSLSDILELTNAKLTYNESTFVNYSYYSAVNATDFLAALQANIDTISNRLARDYYYNSSTYESRLSTYKEVQSNVKALVATITKSQAEFNKLLESLETYAKNVYASYQEYQYALSVYNALNNLSSTSVDELILDAQQTIYNYKSSIVSYNSNIENAANNVTDNATLISYYTTVLAQIKSEIKVQQAIADKYGKLLGATSAAATTTAE